MPPGRRKPVAASAVRSGWRYWLWHSVLLLAAFLVLAGCSLLAVGLVIHLRFGAEIAASIAYSAWAVLMIFFPGRGNPGYNPFGAAVRRVGWPLLQTHLLALAIVVPMVAAALWVHARYAPRWLVSVCVVLGIAVSMVQSVRSLTLLENSAEQLRNEQAPTSKRVRTRAPSA